MPPSPRRGASRAQAYVTSSSGRSRVRSVHARIRNCAARRDQKPRPAESDPREVSNRGSTQSPQRVSVATAPTRTPAPHPAGRPRQKARSPPRGKGAQGWDEGGERTDPAKSVHLLRERCRKTASLPCKRETQPERQEVRPVTRGQRPANPRRRPRGHGADATTFAGVSAPRPARGPRQGASEPGAEASLENSDRRRSGRSRHETGIPPAAESGVGKHTARESESAQACVSGKERVANAHSHISPGDRKVSGAFCLPASPGPSAPTAPRPAPPARRPAVILALS